MTTSKALCLACLAICFGSAARVTDPTDRLRYYTENVRSHDSGVYEHDGDLYVHVRKPLNGSASQTRVRMQAIIELNDLLRGWMVDYARTNHADSVVADVAEWQFSAKGQEFTGSGDGLFWMGQVYDRETVIGQIPEKRAK